MPAHMKDTIATTYQEMVKRRNVDKITVKDLVEECGISRQTFYYHFQDITDVVAWSIQKGLQQSLKLSLEAEDSETALQYFVDATKENRPIIERLLQSRRREQVEVMVLDAIRTFLEELLRHRKPDLKVNDEDLDLALRFATYGVAGILLDYRVSVEDEAKQVHKVHQLLVGELFHFDQ